MVGNRLKDQRAHLKLSPEQMASRLGMTKESYIRYESNADFPSLMKLIEMAAILEVSIDYLLSGEYDRMGEARQSGKYLVHTPNGFACSEKSCGWRQDCGGGKFYCPGAGCMKEWCENHAEH